MKVRYDHEVDAAYIQLSSKRPTGAIELKEGVILHGDIVKCCGCTGVSSPDHVSLQRVPEPVMGVRAS